MSDIFLKATTKGAKLVVRKIKHEQLKKDKAIRSSIKGEAFRLRKVITQGIRKANPGGNQLNERTVLARRRNDKWGNKKPFRGMITSTRYDFNPATLEARIGWTQKSPERLRKIAKRYQEGYSVNVTTAMREYLAKEGGKLSKR